MGVTLDPLAENLASSCLQMAACVQVNVTGRHPHRK